MNAKKEIFISGLKGKLEKINCHRWNPMTKASRIKLLIDALNKKKQILKNLLKVRKQC